MSYVRFISVPFPLCQNLGRLDALFAIIKQTRVSHSLLAPKVLLQDRGPMMTLGEHFLLLNAPDGKN